MKPLFLLLPAFTSALVKIPLPEGPYGVSLANVQMNDTTRTDPYTNQSYRVLPVTLIVPSGPVSLCHPVYQPYMPNATAYYWEQALTQQYGIPLANTFSQLQLSLCAPHPTRRKFPLIFFSAGLGFPRQFYSILATKLAAQGYVVVQVGVPGEIDFIEFPDGRIERGHANITDAAQHAAAVDVRVRDISFVLDSLSAYEEQLGHITCNIDATSPSIFGHSFGGATALATLITDDRFVGGANEDGAFWGIGLNSSTERPFMILASTPNYTRELSTVPNWAEVWPHLEGPKWLLSIENSTHNSFVDIDVIAAYFGLRKSPLVRDVLGEIDPVEMLRVEAALLAGFANFLSRGADIQSIDAIASSLEEVDILNSTTS